jgi:hypothetical protein
MLERFQGRSVSFWFHDAFIQLTKLNRIVLTFDPNFGSEKEISTTNIVSLLTGNVLDQLALPENSLNIREFLANGQAKKLQKKVKQSYSIWFKLIGKILQKIKSETFSLANIQTI